MNTKIVMILSSIFLGAIGITFTFIPDEVISNLSGTPDQISSLLLQLLGALYLGFSIMNWMAKGSLIGGIYNRPIAIGNFMHFTVGAFALIKIITKIQTHLEIVIPLTVFYSVFALLFAYVFRTNPTRIEKKE
jgi:hypothetical protein